MLQFIRERLGGWFFFIFLALIGLAFTFWGVDFGIANKRNVAQVNGESIPAHALLRNYQDQLARFSQLFGGAELSEEEQNLIKKNVVDQAINAELLQQYTDRHDYHVSDRTLFEAIQGTQEFQEDGQFSPTRYQAVLANAGRSPTYHEYLLRRSMQVSQLREGVSGTAFITPMEAAQHVALKNERREVVVVERPVSDYLNKVSVTEAEIESYYQANLAQFMTTETIDADYVVLTLDSLMADIDISEDKVQAFYQDQLGKGRFDVSEETRRGRHILLSVDVDADDIEKQAAEAKANALLARINAGEDFADIARAESEDPGSKNEGGDLGYANRSQYVGAFADAMFSMDKNEIRGPIKTRFGYHILQLMDIKPSETQSLAEVRAELVNELKLATATELFNDSANELETLAFEYAGTLEPVADGLGLPIQSAAGLSRNMIDGPFSDPAVLNALFSDVVLKGGENTRAIELTEEGSIVVARVVSHTPAQQKPLADVKANIKNQLKQDAARRLALEEAKTFVESNQNSYLSVAASKDKGWIASEATWFDRNDTTLNGLLKDKIFATPVVTGQRSEVIQVETPDTIYLAQILSRQPGVGVNPVETTQLAALRGQAELKAYQQALRNSAKININLDQLQ